MTETRVGFWNAFQMCLIYSAHKCLLCFSPRLLFTLSTRLLHNNMLICKCGCGPLHNSVCSLCVSAGFLYNTGATHLEQHIWPRVYSVHLANTASWLQGLVNWKRCWKSLVCWLLQCTEWPKVCYKGTEFNAVLMSVWFSSKLETWICTILDQAYCDEWGIISSSKQWPV